MFSFVFSRLGIAVLLAGLLLGNAGSRAFAESGNLDLESYVGKVVYLDFWASWCTPCRAAFPFMGDLAAEFGDDLAIVAVNLDKKKELATAFLEEFEVNFDIVYDPDGAIAAEYELKGMPTSFLIDRTGKLVAQHIGFRKKDVADLHAAVKAAIEP